MTVCMLFELTTMVFVDSQGIELTNKSLSQALQQVKHGTDFVRIGLFKEFSFVCETADRQIFRC